MVRCWLFADRRGRDSSSWTFRDHLAGDVATYARSNADTLYTNGPAGSAYQFGANGDGHHIETGTTLSKWGVGATSLTVVSRAASFGSNPNLEEVFSTSGGWKILTTRRASSDTNGFALMWSSASLANYWNWGADGDGQFVGASYTPGGALTAGRWYTVGGSYRRDTSVGTYGGYWSLFVDGIHRGTNNQALAGSFGGTFTDRVPRMNGHAGATSVADKRFDYVYVWNVPLSAQEHVWLNDDPFDLFTPRRSWGVAMESAGGGGGNRRRRVLLGRAA